MEGRRRLLLCVVVLFAQQIPKELILLYMDGVAFTLENVESQGISNITVKLRGGISKFTVPGPFTFLHRIKSSGVKIRPALKKSYLFHKLEDMKADIAKIIITCEKNYSR